MTGLPNLASGPSMTGSCHDYSLPAPKFLSYEPESTLVPDSSPTTAATSSPTSTTSFSHLPVDSGLISFGNRVASSPGAVCRRPAVVVG